MNEGDPFPHLLQGGRQAVQVAEGSYSCIPDKGAKLKKRGDGGRLPGPTAAAEHKPYVSVPDGSSLRKSACGICHGEGGGM